MSVATEITRLNKAKSDLKRSITNLGEIVSDEDTIDEYSKYLDDIYDDLPKVTDEGTSISLDNTRVGKLETTLKGNTSQTGTPTPSSPIPVNVVSGDNSVSIYSRNLFDESQLLQATGWTKDNNSYYTGLASDLKTKYGTTTGGFTFANTFKENTQYTISCNFYSSVSNGNNRFYFEYTDGTSSVEPWNETSPTNKSVTSTAGKTIRKICFDCNTNARIIYFKNIMLNEGTTALDYVPYTGATYLINLPEGMELCKIGDYQDYFYKDSGKWYLHNEIGKIASYNGETITTSYISTTGGLDTGATVYYVLATPTNTEITYQPLIEQLNNLEKAMSKDGQTNISQVNNDLPFIISASALKEWQESASLSMSSPLSLGNTLNTQQIDLQPIGNDIKPLELNEEIEPIEVDNVEPLEEGNDEES